MRKEEEVKHEECEDIDESEAGTTPMTLMEAIYKRASVRDFTSQMVEKNIIDSLLETAVRAPTALGEECWSFVVIQDKSLLKRVSDVSKAEWIKEPEEELLRRGLLQAWIDSMKTVGYDLLHDAGTLLLICAPTDTDWGADDCWLAAQNIMLAATSIGLGTCVMGSAVKGCNTSEMKSNLGIPQHMAVVVPIIVGYPAGEVTPTERRAPSVVWKC